MNNINIQDELNQSESIQVSIKSGSDIIIGQICYLTVILKADYLTLEKIEYISIKDETHSVTANRMTDWKIMPGNTSGSATFQLQISHDLVPEALINYTVHAISSSGNDVQGITPQPVTYTAKKIADGSHIHLDYDKDYLVTPTTDNGINEANSEYTLISSTITDEKGQLLKNVGVTITSVTAKELEQVVFTTDEKSPTTLKVENVEESHFFTVYSDPDGKIKFRIYPKKNTAVRLNLMTAILGVTTFALEYTLYIVTPSSGIFGTLGSPIIRELDSDNCIRQNLNSASKSFHVRVPKYINYQYNDAILFFLQKNIGDVPDLLYPISIIKSEESLTERAFEFPYSDLPFNETVGFYYVIAPIEGDMNYSYPISVTYLGGEEKSPKDQIYRQYNKVKIYSSIATPPIDTSSDQYEVHENDSVTNNLIDQQKNSGININDITGLYVIVQASKDPKNKSLPLIGQSGGVNLYYTSRTRNNQKTYPFKLNNEGENTVKIPYCALNRAAAYHNGIDGELFFDYYIDDGNGTKTYSKIWNGGINTAYLDQDDNDLEGCSPDL
ncbi:hypothetical protein [Xenorhabdus sp. PB62.4]|uniref:hypothetical protein n=1 Tax=Xenorhabdus sp. PB62.4 TaxID=1851573 RepID=UPI001656A972|nr:hypothetical protein [Xenorhabdus sp. PB62.4]